MTLDRIHKVYFLGIGGIGMSALARYFNQERIQVAGYDKSRTNLTDALEREGIKVTFDDAVESLPEWVKNGPCDEVLIVYTPAIPSNHRQLNWIKEKGFTVHKRSIVLAEIANPHECVAVAGTHGKTTTSSMIAHILTDSGHGCKAFLGGVAANYNTNVLLDAKSNVAVVEADEFDRSFLTLEPNIAIITSIDADHLDIYGSGDSLEEAFNLFAKKIKPGGHLIIKEGLPVRAPSTQTYGPSEEADYQARNILVRKGKFHFDLVFPDGTPSSFELRMPGRHNVENATAAIAACHLLGLLPKEIAIALARFTGVKRRFEIHVNSGPTRYIDDYAHHPAEIRAAIQAARELYPEKAVTVVFQPHLFSRTRDFAQEFAESLTLADEIILLPIYPARELPIAGIDSQMLLNKMSTERKKLVTKSDLLGHLRESRPEVLMTLGAGDIDQLVNPIVEQLT